MGEVVQCVECGAWGPIEEAGDGEEPLCPGCSDPYGIVAGSPVASRDLYPEDFDRPPG